jgi:hypothetical protein
MFLIGVAAEMEAVAELLLLERVGISVRPSLAFSIRQILLTGGPLLGRR